MESEKRTKITSEKENTAEMITRTRVKKSGEIFHTECGKFLFVCSYCNTTWRTGNSIVKHIVDSHFPPLNIENTGPTIATPEFVSIDDLKPEIKLEATAGPDRKMVDTDRPVRIIPSVASERVKTENVSRCDNKSTTSTEMKCDGIVKCRESTNRLDALERVKSKVVPHSVDKTVSSGATNETTDWPGLPQKRKTEEDKSESSSPAEKIVKIVKLKRIKPNPGLKKMKMLNKTDVTNTKPISTYIKDIKKPPGIVMKSCSQPIAKNADKPSVTTIKSVVEPIDSIHRQSCYQCKMVPEICKPTDTRRHICPFCKIRLQNHDQFERHIKDIHKKDPAYMLCQEFYCYKCRQVLPSEHYLTVHIEMHRKKDVHLCPFCGSTYKTNGRLLDHMKKHDGPKYKCDECGKKFRRIGSLRQHYSLHEAEQSSFVCPVCSKGFKLRRYLNHHMALHDEPKWSCRHCDAKFHFTQVRRAHERSRHIVM